MFPPTRLLPGWPAEVARAAELLKQSAVERGLMLAVAESLTCGNLQALIGSVSGASRFFVGGVTAYALRQKVDLLGVDEAHATAVNCVSDRVAIEMATGVASRMGADLAVATTGYAEVSTEWHVVTPFAYCAVWCKGSVEVERVEVADSGRIGVQRKVSAAALNLLVRSSLCA